MSQMIPHLPTDPPWLLDPTGEWLTVGQFAKRWRMHRYSVQRWCKNGEMLRRGYAVWHDKSSYLGRFYIRVPHQLPRSS